MIFDIIAWGVLLVFAIIILLGIVSNPILRAALTQTLLLFGIVIIMVLALMRVTGLI